MPATNGMPVRIVKRAEAVARQDAYDSLTPAQKLERLDARLGKNKGARKERARLVA